MKKLTSISLLLAVFIVTTAFKSSPSNKKIYPLKTHEISLDYLQFLKYLQDGNPDSLEGVYATYDKRYVIALIKNESKSHDFIGVVVASDNPTWKAGELKFNFVRNSAEKLEGYFYDDQGKEHPVSLEIGKYSLGSKLLEKLDVTDLLYEQLVGLLNP